MRLDRAQNSKQLENTSFSNSEPTSRSEKVKAPTAENHRKHSTDPCKQPTLRNQFFRYHHPKRVETEKLQGQYRCRTRPERQKVLAIGWVGRAPFYSKGEAAKRNSLLRETEPVFFLSGCCMAQRCRCPGGRPSVSYKWWKCRNKRGMKIPPKQQLHQK